MSDESPTPGISTGVSRGMDLGDSPLPSNLPSLRRVSPKFSRNTIDVISARRDLKREWHEIPASKVEAGDTVAEVGQVANALTLEHDVYQIRLENVLGNHFYLLPDQKVLAFIRV